MTIESDIQKLAPGARVDLFELDYSALGGTVVYFHAGTNELATHVVWQGITYSKFPVEASGFERSGQGTQPQPKVRVANIDGVIGALCLAYDDLLGAKITRRRTFVKYLDAVNFTGGINATADPTVEFNDEIWFVNRKVEENFTFIDFELASASDIAGAQLPRRQCVANTCTWLAIGGYRGPYCGYAGAAVADANDMPTSDMAVDKCGGRITSCNLRFPDAELPHGGFPGAGLVR